MEGLDDDDGAEAEAGEAWDAGLDDGTSTAVTEALARAAADEEAAASAAAAAPQGLPLLLIDAASFVADAPEETGGDADVALALVWASLTGLGPREATEAVEAAAATGAPIPAPELDDAASLRFCVSAEALLAEGRAWSSTGRGLAGDLAEARRMVPGGDWRAVSYPSALGSLPTGTVWAAVAAPSALPAVERVLSTVRECHRDPLWKLRVCGAVRSLGAAAARGQEERGRAAEASVRGAESRLDFLRRFVAARGAEELVAELRADLDDVVRERRADRREAVEAAAAEGDDSEGEEPVSVDAFAAGRRRGRRQRRREEASIRAQLPGAERASERASAGCRLSLLRAAEETADAWALGRAARCPATPHDELAAESAVRRLRAGPADAAAWVEACGGGAAWVFAYPGRPAGEAGSAGAAATARETLEALSDADLEEAVRAAEAGVVAAASAAIRSVRGAGQGAAAAPGPAGAEASPAAVSPLRGLLAVSLHRHPMFHPQPGTAPDAPGAPRQPVSARGARRSAAVAEPADPLAGGGADVVRALVAHGLGPDALVELQEAEGQWVAELGDLPAAVARGTGAGAEEESAGEGGAEFDGGGGDDDDDADWGVPLAGAPDAARWGVPLAGPLSASRWGADDDDDHDDHDGNDEGGWGQAAAASFGGAAAAAPAPAASRHAQPTSSRHAGRRR